MLQWLCENPSLWRDRSPRTRYPELVREFLAVCPAHPRVLKTDAFNEAENLAPIYDLAPDACVLELDAATCARAAANHPGLTVTQGDIRRIPSPGAFFDAVIDLSTIDHCEEYSVAIAEYHRVLRPGGLLLIVAWLNLCGRSCNGKSDYGGVQHFFEYRAFRAELSRLFEVVDGRILTPAGADTDNLVIGQSMPGADLHAYIGRSREWPTTPTS